MKLEEFTALSKLDQAEYTWTGKLIGQRNEGFAKIMLYTLPQFYVEVFYDTDQNGITAIEPFSNLARLTPYFTRETFQKK
ncbi:hypothetical protein [Mucilaginibacter agri]|uniref:Uncharacterized protein n=1 Tax=Mucilaginibacter agri TaxID=2695265 RepID=A0A965ZEI6_9SPHI|nr:hypothetical protein [Mucilaginibacter agri]NCD68312.1 hypothetical protein [Mucilaginibacter agri]